MLRKLVLGLPLLGQFACGSGSMAAKTDSEVSIYGGTKVTTADDVSKYTVALMQNDRTLCSGVLLSKRIVLSAGHCFLLIDSKKDAFVGFGLGDINSQKVKVKKFKANENFNAEAGKLGGTDLEVNDISLIQLAEDAPAGYEPVLMLTQRDQVTPHETALLAGFGKTDVKSGWFGTVVGELYQVETQLILEAPNAKEVWFGNIPGKGACNGDSGGPALVSRGGSYKLLGVTSRGRNCNSDYIYTDVRYFQNWIATTASAFGA